MASTFSLTKKALLSALFMSAVPLPMQGDISARSVAVVASAVALCSLAKVHNIPVGGVLLRVAECGLFTAGFGFGMIGFTQHASMERMQDTYAPCILNKKPTNPTEKIIQMQYKAIRSLRNICYCGALGFSGLTLAVSTIIDLQTEVIDAS